MGRSNPLLLYKCDKDDQGRGTTNKHSHTDHKRCTFVSQKFGAKEGHAGTRQTTCVYFAAVSAFFFGWRGVGCDWSRRDIDHSSDSALASCRHGENDDTGTMLSRYRDIENHVVKQAS